MLPLLLMLGWYTFVEKLTYTNGGGWSQGAIRLPQIRPLHSTTAVSMSKRSANLRGLERVVWREVDFDCEDTACVWAVLRPAQSQRYYKSVQYVVTTVW